MNPGMRRYKFEDMYEIAGFSRQGHHKYMISREKEEAEERLTMSSILEIRAIHHQMGLKKIYKLISPDWIGRDRFISIGVGHGLGIKQHKSFHRTTFSCKSAWFTNLTAGLVINGINQVWVSDITYYRIGDKFYYLTFIEDVYSRRILGWTASTNLRAEANCRALNIALSERKGDDLKGLIHHSDRGTQYVSDIYLKILSSNNIAVSMCDNVYENTHIERANGIFKNEYLINMDIVTFEELQKQLDRAVKLYNTERPHWSIGAISPCEYERKLKSIPLNDRDILKLYSFDKKIYVQQSFFN
jgi:putative transposase